MNKNFKYLGIPLGVLATVFVGLLIFNKIAKINGDAVWSLLLSKIPIINNFVETDYNTGVFAITQMDMSEMRTAVYNVDFLMSITAPDFTSESGILSKDVRKYLAIYPYVVEAGIDLNNVKSLSSDNKTTVNLPSPQITLSDLDEKRGVIVMRDTDIPAEIVNMMKSVFEKRAVDLAYNAGIIQTAKQKAENYFAALFPKENFTFSFADEPILFDSVASNKTPIKFVYRKNALKKITTFSSRHRKIQPDESKVYFNPADMFLKTDDGINIGLYYNYDDKTTISQVNERVDNQATRDKKNNWDSYIIKYFDCQQDETQKIVAELYLGYNFWPVWFTVGDKQYAFNYEGQQIEGQKYYDTNGELIYLAMCSKKQQTFNTLYEQYLQSYDEVAANVSKGVLGAAKFKFDQLQLLKSQNGETEMNYAEKDLNALISFLANNQCIPTGYDLYDNLLKSAYLFSNKLTKEMTPEFQKMFLTNYKTFGISENNINYILEYFYNLPATSPQDKEFYRNVLIQNGYYNDAIYNSLSAEEFCQYLCSILAKYDNAIYRQDGRTDNPNIVGHLDILQKTKYSRDNVMNFLRRYDLVFDQGEVVWCVRPEGISPDLPLFDMKDYPLILFGNGGAMVIPDYTASTPQFFSARYDKIKIAVTNNSDYQGIYQFDIGGYKNKGKAICLAINEIKQRKDMYSPTKSWSNDIVEELRRNINNYCYRPYPFF
ncbi:MAG: DUF4230 domain-containing protein [Bacteroidales bacterium]|nr:DUF4230 domain-containing protein [Bacteroidales bacterium]